MKITILNIENGEREELDGVVAVKTDGEWSHFFRKGEVRVLPCARYDYEISEGAALRMPIAEEDVDD